MILLIIIDIINIIYILLQFSKTKFIMYEIYNLIYKVLISFLSRTIIYYILSYAYTWIIVHLLTLRVNNFPFVTENGHSFSVTSSEWVGIVRSWGASFPPSLIFIVCNKLGNQKKKKKKKFNERFTCQLSNGVVLIIVLSYRVKFSRWNYIKYKNDFTVFFFTFNYVIDRKIRWRFLFKLWISEMNNNRNFIRKICEFLLY